MRIKQLIDEDFSNYKKISMFIGTSVCDWKCCTEKGLDVSVCQNSQLAKSKTIDVPAEDLYRRYIDNPISKAVVIGGLEPMLQFSEVLELIYTFRNHGCFDDFVIYTGYYKSELHQEIEKLEECGNIVIKYGRFEPDNEKHFDEVLGVYLASKNQYAERIVDNL